MGVLLAASTFFLISISISQADKAFNGDGEIYFTYANLRYKSGIKVIYRPEDYEDCKLAVIYI